MGAIAIGLLCGLAFIVLQFLTSRPGQTGMLVDGRRVVDGSPFVTVPLYGVVVASVVYRFGCLFAYRCEPLRLIPPNIPVDVFFAVGGIACLLVIKRSAIQFDDRHITIGRVFRGPETIGCTSEQSCIRRPERTGARGRRLLPARSLGSSEPGAGRQCEGIPA
jgi:hypothetical protein